MDILSAALANVSKNMALKNSPTNALSRQPDCHEASVDDVISLENIPTKQGASDTSFKGFEVIERPAPTSPTLNIRATSAIRWNDVKWKRAADLTTDYEDIIDSTTLMTVTKEPRPKTPPRRPAPLADTDKMSRNRGVISRVARRAEYWFQGVKKQNSKFGLAQDVPEFLAQQMVVKDDIKFIMDHVGGDEHGVSDVVKVADFFEIAASRLLVWEKQGPTLSKELFQHALAISLVEADVSVDTDKLDTFTELGSLVNRAREIQGECQKNTRRPSGKMDVSKTARKGGRA